MESFISLISLAVLSAITIGVSIPRDDTSYINSLETSPEDVKTSPPPSLPYPLSFLNPRANASQAENVHSESTTATTCQQCSQVYKDCRNVSALFAKHVRRTAGERWLQC
jgi:hypothetical protein